MSEEYRLQVGNQDFFIDLLFYHRGLSALVAFELKIADCLSSIDELITAEAQKLDTLNAHKKVLMQQLFPAVNEVRP